MMPEPRMTELTEGSRGVRCDCVIVARPIVSRVNRIGS